MGLHFNALKTFYREGKDRWIRLGFEEKRALKRFYRRALRLRGKRALKRALEEALEG